MRSKFDEQLKYLKSLLIEMGNLIENSIENSIEAIKNKDRELAKNVIKSDYDINNLEKEIESLCLKIILRQQPVAKDLRKVSSALKLITDMERIGDQSSDICEIALLIMDKDYVIDINYIIDMAKITKKMVNYCIDSFVKEDISLVEKVVKLDDDVDNLFLDIREQLIQCIKDENVDDNDQVLDLLMISKYFERIGDHAENIVEWVEFSITGIHKNNKIL